MLFLFSKAVLRMGKREKNSTQPSAIRDSGSGDLIHFQPSTLLPLPRFLPLSVTLARFAQQLFCVCSPSRSRSLETSHCEES